MCNKSLLAVQVTLITNIDAMLMYSLHMIQLVSFQEFLRISSTEQPNTMDMNEIPVLKPYLVPYNKRHYCTLPMFNAEQHVITIGAEACMCNKLLTIWSMCLCGRHSSRLAIYSHDFVPHLLMQQDTTQASAFQTWRSFVHPSVNINVEVRHFSLFNILNGLQP